MVSGFVSAEGNASCVLSTSYRFATEFDDKAGTFLPKPRLNKRNDVWQVQSSGGDRENHFQGSSIQKELLHGSSNRRGVDAGCAGSLLFHHVRRGRPSKSPDGQR